MEVGRKVGNWKGYHLQRKLGSGWKLAVEKFGIGRFGIRNQ